MTQSSTTALPRELAPDTWWIGGCYGSRIGNLHVHAYHSVYVVSGEQRSLVVDTGHPKDWAVVDRHLDQLLARGISPVEHIFPTHVETPHSSNLGRLLERFPAATVCGDVRDYHLVFPEHADRLAGSDAGDEIDLGGRTVRLLSAPFHDSTTTRWAYDVEGRTLFTSDGFSYVHWHGRDECGRAAEEIPGLPLPEFTSFFGDAAFTWMRVVDISENVSELEALLSSLEVDVIAPAHGLPILDPGVSVPRVLEGMRMGQRASREETAADLALRFGAV